MGRKCKQTFLQRIHTDGREAHEKMFNIINYQRNANQTRMRYHFIPVKMAIIKKSRENKCWRECGEKGTLLHCWWEYNLIQPLWETVWRFLKKLGVKLPYDPEIPVLGIYPEETTILKDTYTLVFTVALFTGHGSNLNVHLKKTG